MGRKIKIGLDYFPMDVDFFDDIKVRKLIKHKGSVSVLVYSYLLSLIYKNGYFLKWDEDLPFIIYEKIGQDESYIKDVINYLIDIEMFSKYMFEKENILTSKGIQKRYKKICDTLKRRNSIDRYNLINTEEIAIDTEEIAIDTEETNEIDTEIEINSVESATKERKGMEIKEKEIKENNNKEEIKKEETETQKPLNDEIGLLEQRNYSDLAEYTKNNELWIEAICMNLKLKKETVLNELKHFPIAQRALGRESTDLRNFKEHFNNYLAKKSNELRTAENNKANSGNTELEKIMKYKADYMASVNGGKK